MYFKTKDYKSAEYKNGKVILTYEVKLEELFKEDEYTDYDARRRIEEEITKIIANSILSTQKDKIIKEVLKDVNWSDIVRSEIAQRVIAEVGKKSFNQ